MVLHTSPFPCCCLSILHRFSWALICPFYWLVDRLVASWIPTTNEKCQRGSLCWVLRFIFTTPIYLALCTLSIPSAIFGFLLWNPLQLCRQPYIYSRLEDKSQASAALLLNEWKATGPGKSFCFGTANVCLLPECMARVNNLSNTQDRAKEIGQRIRNGASRPQIKIYIDSPTNTSISAASFSSLASPQGSDGPNKAVNVGIKRTTSMEYKGDNGSPNSSEENRNPKTGGDFQEVEDNACIIRIGGEDGGQLSDPEADGTGDCQMETPPENKAEGQKGQTPNHKAKEGDAGSLDSYTASRESLVKVRIGESPTDQSAVNNKLLHKTSMLKKTSLRKKKHTDEIFDHEISAFFPANLDFLCLQEVFDKRAAGKLKDQLHQYFEYILYDVGIYGCCCPCKIEYSCRHCQSLSSCCSCQSLSSCCPCKILNSGLLFASRYPVIDAVYHCYPNGGGTDAFSSKGALFVKVQVGSTPQDQRIVGYISCTHLQAEGDDSTIRCEQLNQLQDWLADFRKSTSSSSTANPEELVAFDVLCGDFNFDNCSSDDKLAQQHSLFTHYKDPCRVGPGEDKPWAIGTFLKQDHLHDEEVCTPDNLQKALESEEGRREYIAHPTSKSHPNNQKVLVKGNGRRIDYMLYSEEGLYLEWKVEVEEFSFITQLAGLTDHLPVAMRLMVNTGEEEV
ncbi:sphingomyelin phosphodiesterase 3 isoform X2 [Dromiciops gliroides]|uniref:sphingomyelin phosphodiesterase 3 isoform X2 n=1 Tax=Dromiciops gliroides TaxID=33562 RepID=UPI001CC38AC4|nr:sphingomyelin phosphodiesterase 3 isoform X2 [Dromiciops gliroides]